MTITDEQLAEWERLCEEATPGPWKVGRPASGCHRWPYRESLEQCDCFNVWTEDGDADVTHPHAGMSAFDADLAATCRTALPALIAELRWLRYRYATYRAAVEERERRRRPWTGREVVEHAEHSGLSQESVDNILGARAMHPHGRCECCGEGRCEWCQREEDDQ